MNENGIMMKKVFVYRLEKLDTGTGSVAKEETEIKKWNPGLSNFIPPNSPFSYLYFWFMHYLKLFKNPHYCAYVIYKEEVPISSLVCIPSLYRWPFMKPKDLQIKNVFTHQEFRGNGYAYLIIRHAIRDIGLERRSFWYMTDEDNIPSQKLCKKIGFKKVGRYIRKRNKLFIYQGEIV